MELILYTLRTVAYAIIGPMNIIMLVVLGVMFYLKNKRITIMQRMTIGETIDSPLELTLSQIFLGIMGGIIISLMLSALGVVFNENSGIVLMFMISVLLLFVKKRFICFSYSGAVLGALGIISSVLASATNSQSFLNINIVSLMTFVGLMHVVEGILVMFDGGRGAIPVFSNKDNKIVGGYAYSRYWALPVAIFIAVTSNLSGAGSSTIATPSWWPLVNRADTLILLSAAAIMSLPLYGVLGYNSVSFTKAKNKKPLYSGLGILTYGVLLTLVAQVAQFGIIGQIVVVIFAPLGHEIMIRIQNKNENKGKYLYITDEDGVSVLEVAPNSPAFASGIRRGDKIIEVNNSRAMSEVEIFTAVRESFNEITLKVRKISGEIVDLRVKPINKKVGMLVVPKMVEVESTLSVDNDDFKKILEEMKRKK